MSSRRAARLFRPLPAKEGCMAVAEVSGVLDQSISLVHSFLRMAMAQLFRCGLLLLLAILLGGLLCGICGR